MHVDGCMAPLGVLIAPCCCVHQVLGMLVRYAMQADIGVAAHGVALLRGCITEQAPLLQTPGWSAALKALSMAAASDALLLTPVHTHRCRLPALLPLATIEHRSLPTACQQQ